MMVIALGSDHAGFDLKEAIKKHLLERGYEVIDEGTTSHESVDYPVYAAKVGEDVAYKKATFGILCCGTGEGISIAANKINGVRCGIGYNDEVTRLLRQHNDANVIAFGGRFMSPKDVLPRVDDFIETEFLGGRHEIRVEEIHSLEEK